MSALRLKLPRQAQKALMKAILLLDAQVIQPISQMARGAREADCHQPAAIHQGMRKHHCLAARAVLAATADIQHLR